MFVRSVLSVVSFSMNIYKSHIFQFSGNRILYFVFSLMLLTSCGVQKKNTKVLRAPGASAVQGTPSKNIFTDASDAHRSVGSFSITKNYADFLGVDEYVINQSRKLYSFIDEWMGSPHRYGGMVKNGIDCSGFIQILYAQVYNKDLPRISRDMADVVTRKYESQLREGDLVFFSFGRSKIDHVGVYLHNGKFVHVSTKKGVIISSLKDPWYGKYIRRLGRPKV